MIDANRIKRLIQKLKSECDITTEEANEICDLYSIRLVKTVFNSDSLEFDYKLSQSLKKWYDAVAEQIRSGRRGNFVSTVTFLGYAHFLKLSSSVRDAIEKYSTFEDLCNTIMIDEKTYSALPCKHLFKEIPGASPRKAYKMESNFLGMCYRPTKDGARSISELLSEYFLPVATITAPDVGQAGCPGEMIYELAYRIAVGASEIPNALRKYETKPVIFAAFMRNNDISCIAAADLYKDQFVPTARQAYKNRFTFSVERDKAPLVKEALKIPFEELVQNALDKNVISKKMAVSLLGDERISNFPIKEFVQTCAEYIGEIARKKVEWKTTRQIIEGEAEWLTEIR